LAIRYEVILTDKAKEELEGIYNYISKSLLSKNTANNVMKRIENKILNLTQTPESYSIIEPYTKTNEKYRKLIINNYIVVYRIDYDNNKVYVIRIIYGKRNYLNEEFE